MVRKLTSKVDASVARVYKQATSKKYSEKSVFPKEGKEKLTVNVDTDTSIQLATLAKKCRMSRGQLIDELVRGFGDKIKPQKPAQMAAKEEQIGGNHYKDMKIQPIEYILGNNLNYCEANVVKYISRWKSKGGIEDLRKAKHYIDLLIESASG